MKFPVPMRPFLATGLTALALSACETPSNPTSVGAGGVTEIRISAGMNCYDKRCFQYQPDDGTISVNGRRPTLPPAGVTLADGSITAAQFDATFQKGMMARTIGESNR